MKTILTSLLALSLITFAEPIKIAWDKMDEVEGFRIYQGEIMLLQIPKGDATEATIDFPPGEITITATAYNFRGESLKSKPLTIPSLPPEVKLDFSVTIEGEMTITIKRKIAEQ